MMVRPKTRWIFLLSLILVLTAFSMVRNLDAGRFVGTQKCIECHQTWLDNNPATEDVVSGAVSTDYPPLNLSSTRTANPWYTIPEGYVNSIHNIPSFNLTKTDNVPCEACHGGGQAHFGLGNIPVPIPNIKTCAGCHKPPYFEISEFLLTSHANADRTPGKYFDQPGFGLSQAKTRLAPVSGSELVPLFKAGTGGPLGDPVSRNERIEECSVCHQYALQYPVFRKMIAQGNLPAKPEVSCSACHDAHIVAPAGNQPAGVNTTVKVTGITGSNVTAVAPVEGREVLYINHKPYKVNDDGAQDTIGGTWTRGSAINGPTPTIHEGVGIVGNSSEGVADTFTYIIGGFLGTVQSGDTLLISGKASATVNLPNDALNAGAPVTVEATLDKAGFLVNVVESNKNIILGTFDQTLVIDSREDPARDQLIAQLGTDKIGIVAKAPVTYKKAAGGTGTLNVFVPFIGQVPFEVRDMRTNTQNLCQSCHTQGKYKYTAWGKRKDGTLVDLSPTHNNNIGGQYRRSGHGDTEAIPFKEFSAFEYGSSHQPTYPFDMTISGSGGANSLRNKGNTTFKLTQTPNPANVYIGAPNLVDQVVLINNYQCNQCHHGLGAIDYLLDRQGTQEASVLWGDATVVCLTCHSTHKDATGTKKNIRVPVKLSYNPRFVDATKNPRGGINKMMDGTDIPAGVGDGIICLFCHQGRESGLTVYQNIKSRGVDPYTEPDKLISGAGISFQNPHYLESGAIVWSKNTWEYLTVSGAPVPNKYSTGNVSHQQKNCTGCHMGEASADNSEGGHTWRPRIETCQNAQCHPGATSFQSIKASADYDGDGVVESAFSELGTINPDTGLYGQLKAALAAKGIFYNPDSYPYFFTSTGGSFTAWTTNTLSAAFNLSFLYKGGNCTPYHNIKYAAQVLVDSMKALGVTSPGYKNRPAGDRSATDYSKIIVNP